jgi:hypothetical protein
MSMLLPDVTHSVGLVGNSFLCLGFLFPRHKFIISLKLLKAEWSLYVPAALALSNVCILYLWFLYDSHCKQRLFP